uniref:Uncharacterized protein n=1 Tax=viral metagenome TaxID=1070528 RepID=A0A6M3LJY9_9ZZZZ
MNKLSSGRFLMTLIAGIVFLWGSVTNILPADKQFEIIMLVLVFYFNRTDRNGIAH